MKNLLKKYAAVVIGVAALISLAGVHQALAIFNPVGGGTYLLQSSISASQTTITLTSFAEPGSAIAYTMGYINSAIAYGTISPSSGNSEFISFTGITQNANGSATLTGISRGLARTPGTGGCVASSTLAHAYPGQTQFILSNSPCYYSQYAVKQNNESVSGLWLVPDPVSAQGIASRNYVDGKAFGGIGGATETATGTVQIATQTQAASSTTNGSLGRLVLPSSISTSTYNAATAPLSVVVTQNNGKIDSGFIATSTLFVNSNLTGTTTAATTTNIGDFPAWQIGKQYKFFTNTGTTTFAVPSGITKIQVQVIGGGGQGGGANTASGSGGGAGGYSFKIVDVSGTSTIQLAVGVGGSGAGVNNPGAAGSLSVFGPSTASFYMAANGGGGGATTGSGPSGGSATGGDFNISGGRGGPAGPGTMGGGMGGVGFFGGDGAYGAGGMGCTSGSTCAGNGGQNGAVIVQW